MSSVSYSAPPRRPVPHDRVGWPPRAPWAEPGEFTTLPCAIPWGPPIIAVPPVRRLDLSLAWAYSPTFPERPALGCFHALGFGWYVGLLGRHRAEVLALWFRPGPELTSPPPGHPEFEMPFRGSTVWVTPSRHRRNPWYTELDPWVPPVQVKPPLPVSSGPSVSDGA